MKRQKKKISLQTYLLNTYFSMLWYGVIQGDLTGFVERTKILERLDCRRYIADITSNFP